MKKTITIYPTSIKVSEGMTLDDLTVVDGFEELLNSSIAADRFKEIADAFKEVGVGIHSVVAPDGFADEVLIDKEILKVILDANKNGGGAYGKYFDAPTPEVVGISDEDFDKLTPLFKVARQLGISFQFNTCSTETLIMDSMLFPRKTNAHLLKKKEPKFYQTLNKKRKGFG